MSFHWLLTPLTAILATGAWAVALAEDGPAPAAPKAAEGPAAADSDAPLPQGWPAATKPDAIEIKAYPAYRSAVARDAQATMKGQAKLFWPLFIHIQKEGIAMTAPVVMTYEPRILEQTGATGEASMEFLYRQPDQGRAGPAGGTVKVEDRPAATFVCLGLQGPIDEARLADSIKRLRGWLEDHKTEWVEAGPPRQLGYHGPSTPVGRRLWEVQIPVKAAEAKAGATRNTPGGEPASIERSPS